MRFRQVMLGFAILLACSAPPAEPDGTTDVTCPGSLQCPCPCEEPMFCGPNGACTLQCTENSDCGGLPGETCVAGYLCGVVCDPGSDVDDCAGAGMPGATCQSIAGHNVCSYSVAS